MTGTGSSATWARHAPPSWSNPTPSPPTASTPGARSCSSTASGGSPTPASTSTLTPGTPAGGALGRWPIACCAPASSTYVQGFSVNVANRQTTRQSYRWGGSSRTSSAGAEFVIDTSRNGLGPPSDESDRDDESCNPRRQALGQAPTARTGMPGLAALLWSKLPGESDGICGGETTDLLSDSSTTLDGQQPVRAGRGPAACGGRRRFADWTRRGHRKLVRWTRPGTL